MKTFIIRLLVGGVTTGNSVVYNPATGTQQLGPREVVTEITKSNFRSELSEWKQRFYTAIKPMLTKGGFVFDPTLWKWEFKDNGPYQFNLWATITFVDPYDEGSAAFMGYVKQTGILKFDHIIVKRYS